MKVFKFGGASVKDANGVKNLVKVLRHEGIDNKIVIISAMGKMTNAFEEIVNSYCNGNENLTDKIAIVRNYHTKIINDLFDNKSHSVYMEVEQKFAQLSGFMAKNKSNDYNFIYDQIVSYGELLSTTIISLYLNKIDVKNDWVDVREYIKTDSAHRGANVNWETTQEYISSKIKPSKLTITQGFIAYDGENTTTLGREGSDYSAAIFAYCLNAQSVTIWKDVQGVLNADPRHFKSTELLTEISYREAIEMAFYGASVIHPKTLKPLENKLIPLHVRSFIDVDNKGTTVQKGKDLEPKIPCFILKKNQILLSISALDFSFMVEHNIRDIFNFLHDYKLKVNLIQNSALSFSVCIEDKFNNFNEFYDSIKSKYKVNFNENTTLYTIRHFDENSVIEIENNNKVLLKQISKETLQVVIL
jgi:aspartate kinase